MYEQETQYNAEKMAAEKEAAEAYAAGTTTGSAWMGLGRDMPRRLSFQKRLQEQVNEYAQESRKNQQRQELLALLNKHPDVARILDLVREIGI